MSSEAEPNGSSAVSDREKLVPWWLAPVEKTLESDDGVTLRLVDEQGLPVAGARLGIRARWDRDRSTLRQEGPEILSDAEGIARIESKGLLKPAAACDPSVPCFAFHEERGLAGTRALTLEKDWGKTFILVMRPVVRVKLALQCKQLEDRGRPMEWSKAFIRLPGNSISYLLRDTQAAPHHFEYLLPPGNYEAVTFGGIGRIRETVVIVKCFTIAAGESSIDLGAIQLSAQCKPVPFADQSKGLSRLPGQTEPSPGH